MIKTHPTLPVDNLANIQTMSGLCSEVLISEVSEGFVVVFYKTGSWAQASLSQDVKPLYF